MSRYPVGLRDGFGTLIAIGMLEPVPGADDWPDQLPGEFERAYGYLMIRGTYYRDPANEEGLSPIRPTVTIELMEDEDAQADKLLAAMRDDEIPEGKATRQLRDYWRQMKGPDQ